MKPDQPPPTSRIPELGRFEKGLLRIVVLGALGVGSLGLYSSYDSVSAAADRWGFNPNWILPVALDISIPVFSLANLLLIRFDMALSWVRFVPWALTVATVYLNVAAAEDNRAAQIGHGALPMLWVVCSEIAAHVYRVLIGHATGRRMERVRWSRWVMAPISTARLWRRMTLWEVTSYRVGLKLEFQRLMARAELRDRFGRKWRRKVTRKQLVQMQLGELAPAGATTDEAAAKRPKHVICEGFNGEALFLRRPKPIKEVTPTQPAGPVGGRLLDLATVLSGTHAPVVYFVSNGDRIKIGTSTNLRARIKRLCLRVADIALVLHGGQVYERQLHDRFGDYRIGDTEWFELAGDLASFVATGGGGASAKKKDAGQTAGASYERATLPAPSASGDSLATAGDRRILAPEEALAAVEEAVVVAGASGGDSSADAGADIADGDDSDDSTTAGTNPSDAGGKRRKRRSMEEWLELATPIYHAEMRRLRKQPTGEQFAEAIELAGYGSVSPSTAKNIRTAIQDEEAKRLTGAR